MKSQSQRVSARGLPVPTLGTGDGVRLPFLDCEFIPPFAESNMSFNVVTGDNLWGGGGLSLNVARDLKLIFGLKIGVRRVLNIYADRCLVIGVSYSCRL